MSKSKNKKEKFNKEYALSASNLKDLHSSSLDESFKKPSEQNPQVNDFPKKDEDSQNKVENHLRFNIEKTLIKTNKRIVYLAKIKDTDQEIIYENYNICDSDRNLFLDKSETLSKINHPNIIKILDYNAADLGCYIIEEHPSSLTLRDILSPCMTISYSSDIIKQIANGIFVLINNNIYPQSIIPSNIYLSKNNTPVLTGFDLGGGFEDYTVVNKCYIAPETINGGEISEKSYIFSLGAILFEMLTGNKYNENNYSSNDFFNCFSSKVKNVLETSLASDPNSRYQSISDFILAIESIQSQLTSEDFFNIDQFVPVIEDYSKDKTNNNENNDNDIKKLQSSNPKTDFQANIKKHIKGIALLVIIILAFVFILSQRKPNENSYSHHQTIVPYTTNTTIVTTLTRIPSKVPEKTPTKVSEVFPTLTLTKVSELSLTLTPTKASKVSLTEMSTKISGVSSPTPEAPSIAEIEESTPTEVINIEATPKSVITKPEVGAIIAFGKYEQDNITSNGKEEITWKVLDIQENNALLLSTQILDARRFHNQSQIKGGWAESELRKWIMNDFYNTAFSKQEMDAIVVIPQRATTKDTSDDTDKVFVLSVEQIKKYLPEMRDRQFLASTYAIQQRKVYRGEDGYYNWWTRSNHVENGRFWVDGVDIVRKYGEIMACKPTDADLGILPAIWINIDKYLDL